MTTRKALESEAKSILAENPCRALQLFKTIWSEHKEDFNEWDAFNAVRACRTCSGCSGNEEWLFAEVLPAFSESDKVASMHGWLIHTKWVKRKSAADIKASESRIRRYLESGIQQDLSGHREYPCPFTICAFELVDAFAEGVFNANKVEYYLRTLDPNLLSREPEKFDLEDRGVVVKASLFEKWHALMSKALERLGQFDECIEICDYALAHISEYHHDNDLWFKMRKALCEEALGNHDKSEALFKELIASRAGSNKWFLYKNISEVYFEKGDYKTAWKYSVEAVYYGNEYHFMIGLFLLQARVLYRLGRPEDGKVLAELVAAILREHEWRQKEKYSRLFDFYSVDLNSIGRFKQILRQAQKFWDQERYGALEKVGGVIVAIQRNGKGGKVKDEDGVLVRFGRKSFIKRIADLNSVRGANVRFYKIIQASGDAIAEQIEIVVDSAQSSAEDELVGQIVEGTVQSIVDYGVFVRIPGASNGLLHKSQLSDERKADYSDYFRKGDRIKVEVYDRSEKGLMLRETRR